MYKYIYQEGQANESVFVLLHGTGADEKNLLPIAEMLNPNASVLSIRGDVSENGMNRYFKRHAEGQYDIPNLMERGEKLAKFIAKTAKKYDFALEDAIYLGFSNGSNIAINMMLREDTKINKAMLYAPMYPVDYNAEHDLADAKIFLSMGKNDPIVPQSESDYVIEMFTKMGADVTEYWVNSHEITGDNLQAGKEWLEKLTK